MVQAIPIILAVGASVAASTLGKPSVPVIPAPDPDEAQKKANEAQSKIVKSREQFLRRQGTLGPIQLQAPTLKI